MLVDDCVAVPVTEAGRVVEARRLASAVAARLGFSDSERGKVARVAGEAASAVASATHGGAVFVRPVESAGTAGIEILALDKEPPGGVLGEIARLSAFFDFLSGPDAGTALLSRLWAAPPAPGPDADLEVGVVSVPRHGEEIAGDAWGTAHPPGKAVLALAGGAGYGAAAAKASREAIRIVQESAALEPGEIVEVVRRALRRAPRISLAVVSIERESRRMRCAALGSVAATLVTATGVEPLFSGIEGALSADSAIVLHTEGIVPICSLGAYPDLLCHSASLVAGILYRDFSRRREDVTVMVASQGPRVYGGAA